MPRGGKICAALVVGLTLAACSSGADDKKPDGSKAPGGASSGAAGPGGSSSAAAPVSVTVASSGDILVHVPVRKSAASFARQKSVQYDFDPMFAEVKPVLDAADVAICHQETPISRTNDDLSPPGSLVYQVPREIAPALKTAGFDGCDTASNHVWDRGAKGIDDTRAELTAAGLKVAGPTTSPTQPGMPVVYEAKGVKIANLSYTYTLLNEARPSLKVPPGQPQLKSYLWPVIGVQQMIADARKAKEAGADLVVLNVHWGAEYVKKPTQEQTAAAKQLLASPYVDGIFGAHAHLIQPCSTMNGKTVFYGLGNFLSNQGPGQAAVLGPANADGAVAKYQFTRGADGRWTQKATYQPTMVDIPGRHVIRLSTPSTNPDSFKRTQDAMNSSGDCKATPAYSG